MVLAGRRQIRPISTTLSRTSPRSRRRSRAISSVERPRTSKLPSSVSSASDHSLPVSAAGGSSSTTALCGSTMKVPMTRRSASRSGFGGPLRNSSFLYRSPDPLTAHSLGAEQRPSPSRGREQGTRYRRSDRDRAAPSPSYRAANRARCPPSHSPGRCGNRPRSKRRRCGRHGAVVSELSVGGRFSGEFVNAGRDHHIGDKAGDSDTCITT